ncbi:MAG: hypothetical protein GJU76_10730 [Gallionella sp.]|jgi:Cu/Ag efflux protein CusF|nr:hypothetical protein [Gallionella sp.]
MKNSTLVLAVTLGMVSGMAQAEMSAHDMAQMSMQPQPKQEGRGLIKAVNGNTVQLAHEAIPALHWPPMTMWFSLRDPLPAGLKVGDRVRFELQQSDGKKWTISKIERE